MNDNVHVLLTGTLLQNQNLDEAALTLGKLFKINLTQAQKMLARAPLPIKKNIDPHTAERFVAALAQAGIGAEILFFKSHISDIDDSEFDDGADAEVVAPQPKPILVEQNRLDESLEFSLILTQEPAATEMPSVDCVGQNEADNGVECDIQTQTGLETGTDTETETENFEPIARNVVTHDIFAAWDNTSAGKVTTDLFEPENTNSIAASANPSASNILADEIHFNRGPLSFSLVENTNWQGADKDHEIDIAEVVINPSVDSVSESTFFRDKENSQSDMAQAKNVSPAASESNATDEFITTESSPIAADIEQSSGIFIPQGEALKAAKEDDSVEVPISISQNRVVGTHGKIEAHKINPIFGADDDEDSSISSLPINLNASADAVLLSNLESPVDEINNCQVNPGIACRQDEPASVLTELPIDFSPIFSAVTSPTMSEEIETAVNEIFIDSENTPIEFVSKNRFDPLLSFEGVSGGVPSSQATSEQEVSSGAAGIDLNFERSSLVDRRLQHNLFDEAMRSAEPWEYSVETDTNFLTIRIPMGQALRVEASAMATLNNQVTLCKEKKSAIRRVLTGEPLTLNTFTSHDSEGEIGISPALAGEIIHVQLAGNAIVLQSSGYVAATPGVLLANQKPRFAAKAPVLLRCSGWGDLWFNAGGSLIEIDSPEDYLVSMGNLLAFTEGLEFKPARLDGQNNSEGWGYKFKGEGKLWIQSLSIPAMSSWVRLMRSLKS